MTTTSDRWLLAAPHAPFRVTVAERLFRHAVGGLPVTVSFPDGSSLGLDGPLLRVVRPAAFFHNLGAHGNIVFR